MEEEHYLLIAKSLSAPCSGASDRKRSIMKVKLYSESQPIFDRFNITRQLENAFTRQVHLKSGGYIVIDETEALVAIDVNTGRHKGGKDQDSTIVRVNLEAAEED